MATSWDGVKSTDPFFDGDEADLPRHIVNKYFRMLKEVEWGYKGRPAIISTTPDGKPNPFYEIFMNQDKNN